jgi:hypothetical protein
MRQESPRAREIPPNYWVNAQMQLPFGTGQPQMGPFTIPAEKVVTGTASSAFALDGETK